MFGRTLALVLATAALAAPALAQEMSVEDARAADVVRIGVQADNPPWSFVNSAGEHDGFDADMARAFAEHLGREVEFGPWR